MKKERERKKGKRVERETQERHIMRSLICSDSAHDVMLGMREKVGRGKSREEKEGRKPQPGCRQQTLGKRR